MIHHTFYNISEDKRERLLAAAKAAFSSGPRSSITVSDIVDRAGIARGSFYQYFDTLEDVLSALWESIRREKQERFSTIIKESGGDLFQAAQRIFVQEYRFFQAPDMRLLADNLESSFFQIFPPPEPSVNTIPETMDMTNLVLSGGSELNLLLEMISCCLIENIRRGIRLNLGEEELTARLARQLKMLKDGVMKEDR